MILLLVAPVALAHPDGASGPPTVRLSADGHEVVVDWTAPPDDAALIGTVVGLLPDGAMESFLGGPVTEQPTDEQVRALTESPELRSYLLEHVQVRQEGRRCPGRVDPSDDFLTDGAILTFECPDPVEEVDVRVTILHDQDPGYDTFGLDGTLWTVLYTSRSPEHPWAASTADAGSRSWFLSAGAALVLATLLLVVSHLRGRAGAATDAACHTGSQGDVP